MRPAGWWLVLGTGAIAAVPGRRREGEEDRRGGGGGFVESEAFVADMFDAFKKAASGELAGCKSFPVEDTAKNTVLGQLCQVHKPNFSNEDALSNELTFDPTPLLCYSVLYNINSLCGDKSGHGSGSVAETVDQVMELPEEEFCKVVDCTTEFFFLILACPTLSIYSPKFGNIWMYFIAR